MDGFGETEWRKRKICDRKKVERCKSSMEVLVKLKHRNETCIYVYTKISLVLYRVFAK